MMMYSLAVTQTAPELSANATAAPVPCRERQLWNATSCSLEEQLAHTRTTSHTITITIIVIFVNLFIETAQYIVTQLQTLEMLSEKHTAAHLNRSPKGKADTHYQYIV